MDVPPPQWSAFGRKRAFAFDDPDHRPRHVGIGCPEKVFCCGRDWRAFSNHREYVFLEIGFIPQHHPESVRGDVIYLEETAFARRKLSPRGFAKALLPRAFFFSKTR